MPKHRLDVAALYLALCRRRDLRGLSWQQVGDETGLPGSFFTRVGRYHKTPSADALCTLLIWLGDGHACAFTKDATDD